MEALNDVAMICPRLLAAAGRVSLVLLWACRVSVGTTLAQPDPTLPPPKEWQSTTLCACEDATEFTSGRTPTRPLFDFSAYNLSTTDKARVAGSSLRWQFCSMAKEQAWARLAYCRSLSEPFDAISLHIKNPNGHALSLHLEALDADGIWYSSPVGSLADERNWRQLTFYLRDFAPQAAQTDPRLGVNFPIIWLAIVVEPLALGTPYTLYLDELESHQAPRQTVEVGDLHTPTALAPGEAIPVRATLVFERPPTARTRIAAMLLADTACVAEADLLLEAGAAGLKVGVPHAVRVRGLKVPPWLPPGRYELQLLSPTVRLTGSGARRRAIAVAGARSEVPSVSVDNAGPRARITVGEQAVAPLVGDLGGVSPAEAERAAEVGARIIAIPATTDYHPFGWAQDVWTSADTLDFAGLDRRAAQTLNSAPDALLLVEVQIASPPWWDAEHPADRQRFGGSEVAPVAMWGRKRTWADLTSAEWAKGALVRLRRLVEHIEASPYRHRVIGYELQAGDLGAWRPWGAGLGMEIGVSEAEQDAFRAWLRQRYNTIDALRVGWGGPPQLVTLEGMPTELGLATWDEVKVPLPQLSGNQREPLLYDPATHAALIDFAHFKAEAPADLLLAMAATAKRACGGKKLVGACYGHLFAQSASPETWRWPHLALSKVMEADDVDFLTAPLGTSQPDAVSVSLSATAHTHGKLWVERGGASSDQVARSAAIALAGDAGFAAPAGAFADLAWLPAAWQRLDRDSGKSPPAASQLGVVVDDMSARYLSESGGLATPLFAGQLAQLRRSGLACKLCTLRDVMAGKAPPAGMYLFLDTFRLDPDGREALRKQVCRDKHTLVWVYAPGAVTNIIGGRSMKDLTGIGLTVVTTPGLLRVRVGPKSPLLDEGFAEGFTYGAGEGQPRFFSAQEAGERLGNLVGTDFGGLVALKFEGYHSVFSAAPAMPAAILRALARRAGMHLYLDDDAPAWFGDGVIALEGTAAGSRSLHLPARATISDLITGETLAANARDITIPLAEGTTGVYGVTYAAQDRGE